MIEQAKGMIMQSQNCTAEEAFAQLRQASMNHNRKLRDIAVALTSQVGQR